MVVVVVVVVVVVDDRVDCVNAGVVVVFNVIVDE